MGDNRNGFKAYDPGLICRGKQYAEDTIYEEKGTTICAAGMMHYCTNPLDCLDYYPLVRDDGNLSDFTTVTAEDEPITDDGSKWATRKLHVGFKLDLKGFINAAFEFLWEKSEFDSNINAKAKTNSDEDNAQLAASGDYAQLAASGYYAQLAASGYNAQLAASGDNAQLAASGDYAQLAASGDYAKLAASGDNAKLAASGDYSVVSGIGINNAAKASIGSWLVLAEWEYDIEKKLYIPVCVRAEKVDGETIKADTTYVLKNGKFVEI